MLFGMVQGGEGGENERCEVTRFSMLKRFSYKEDELISRRNFVHSRGATRASGNEDASYSQGL